MSTRSQSAAGRCGRTFVLILLTPITTLNASQALTLCVGHDGRVALELLVRDRCTCEVRPSGADVRGDAIAGSSRVMDGSSLPCLDIPIPGGSCDNRARTGPAPTDGRQRPIPISVAGLPGYGLLFVNPTPARIGGPDNATQSLLAAVSYYTPLDSILLHV